MGNVVEDIKKDYGSPRWTNEVLDCSMPMTFDTYSKCSYNCQYCFSYFQKLHTLGGYIGSAPRCVNAEKIITMFDNILNGTFDKLSKSQMQFSNYVRDRRIMQWGGLADEFDEFERKYGVTLELLRYFDKIDYPLSFSTKAVWFTEDSRYMDLFRKHTHNWHVKVSIITNDDAKSRKMEKGCPSSSERLKAIKNLSDLGLHVTLRLRPYIIGLSDDFRSLILRAHEAGADSVTTEFFCMESRADERLLARYKEMSRIVGFDIYEFYQEHSVQHGYKRLNKKIKRPIIERMKNCAHDLGMRFHVSDMYCRECNDAMNCCGVPPEWENSYKGHFGKAILIAKEKGYVTFADISDDINRYLGNFLYNAAAGFNQQNSANRAKYFGFMMNDYVRSCWNDIKKANSPAQGYGGVLVPDGKDDNGDIIYKYRGEKNC